MLEHIFPWTLHCIRIEYVVFVFFSFCSIPTLHFCSARNCKTSLHKTSPNRQNIIHRLNFRVSALHHPLILSHSLSLYLLLSFTFRNFLFFAVAAILFAWVILFVRFIAIDEIHFFFVISEEKMFSHHHHSFNKYKKKRKKNRKQSEVKRKVSLHSNTYILNKKQSDCVALRCLYYRNLQCSKPTLIRILALHYRNTYSSVQIYKHIERALALE